MPFPYKMFVVHSKKKVEENHISFPFFILEKIYTLVTLIIKFQLLECRTLKQQKKGFPFFYLLNSFLEIVLPTGSIVPCNHLCPYI